MKLDNEKIFEMVQKIKEGICSKEDLKPLLGGEKLNEIFDLRTQEALIDNIIDNGKIHNKLKDENGINILEGLLNNQIVGDLSEFYIIDSNYILKLFPEQQKRIAYSISGNREDLATALQNLWSKGIRTEACTTNENDNIPMIRVIIGKNEITAQNIVQQLYNQKGIEYDSLYDNKKREFHINLCGHDLYDYLQSREIPLSKITKNNIFEETIKEDIKFFKELFISYSRNGIDTQELRKEILSAQEILQEIIDNNKQRNSIKDEDEIEL